MDWESEFARIGAFWYHDGNPKRPYARLTSGKISNGFFNGEVVAKHAKVLGQACDVLATVGGDSFAIRVSTRPHYCIGPAMGAIKSSGRIAERLECFATYAEKQSDGTFVFNRIVPEPGSKIMLCEDTVTTGGSLEKLKAAILASVPYCEIVPEILALCNRTENASSAGDYRTLPGHRIIALVNRSMPMWDEGENPFISGGKELLDPLRPKGKNWEILKANYD